MGDALSIHRPIALDHRPELVPVDLAEVVVAPLLVPSEVGVGDREAQVVGLGNRHVDELLAELVVGDPLDLPGHRLLGVGRVGVVGPEHHQRRPPPSVQGVLGHRLLLAALPCTSLISRLVALALVERLLLADPDHGPGIGPVRAPGEHHLVGDGGSVDEPADGADVGPGQRRVVEDRRVLVLAHVEQLLQLVPPHAECLGRRVEVETVTGLVLDLGHEDRLAMERGCPA